MAEYRDWRNIPNDIGYVILRKLPEIVDHVWFGAVCKDWYYVAKDYDRLTRPSHGILPMFLVPVSECETQRRFYSLSTGKIYPNVRLLNIPDKRCCGSSYGWLGFVEEDLSVTLINPFRFRKDTIHLASLNTFPVRPYTDTVVKLIVSPDSTPEDYTVLVIYGGMAHLAFIRTGDKDWIYVVDYLDNRVIFEDIIFHKGAVYATDNRFKVVSINIHSHPPQIKILQDWEPFNEDDKWLATYIVESTSGELFAVRRKVVTNNVTILFKVIKLEFTHQGGSDDKLRCVELNTLNGDTIFIGDSYTISVNGSNFDGCVVPNSIYYTDDCHIGDGRPSKEVEDSGIFNVEDKSIVKHYIRDPNHKFKPPAIWILPPYNQCRGLSWFLCSSLEQQLSITYHEAGSPA